MMGLVLDFPLFFPIRTLRGGRGPNVISALCVGIAVAAIGNPARAQSNPGAETRSESQRALFPTQEDPPPVTAIGQTYLLDPSADQTIGAPAWPMVPSVPGTPAPTFVPAFSMPVSLQQSSQPADELTVLWTLSIGTLVEADGQSTAAGALRADVAYSSTDPGGPGCVTMAAISAIPEQTAVYIQQSMAQAAYLPPPVQADEPDNTVRDFCLGTTCSCGRCGNGHRFSAPLFVVGHCNENTALTCCQAACGIMCTSLDSGLSPTEAWIQGQGQFVICMVLQPES